MSDEIPTWKHELLLRELEAYRDGAEPRYTVTQRHALDLEELKIDAPQYLSHIAALFQRVLQAETERIVAIAMVLQRIDERDEAEHLIGAINSDVARRIVGFAEYV